MGKLSDQWLTFFKEEQRDDSWWGRKKTLFNERKAEIIKIYGAGQTFHRTTFDNKSIFRYLLYVSFLIKQQEFIYLEEYVTPYQFDLDNGRIVNHEEIASKLRENSLPPLTPNALREKGSERFVYDRRAAVQYANYWWNSYNPEYERFAVDCTNYVSQCLFAGGAPMRGAPVRDQGWWYENGNWSYSWAVAHSLRWYLSGSTTGLYGTEVGRAEELSPGDVICYDFSGDGRWDHNTIVVAKDIYDMPLVNAHTDNSRNRYWSYEDSAAWTSDIEYKFFRIGK